MPLHPLQGGTLIEETSVHCQITIRCHGGAGEEAQEAEAVGHRDGDDGAVRSGDPVVEGEAGGGLTRRVKVQGDETKELAEWLTHTSVEATTLKADSAAAH